MTFVPLIAFDELTDGVAQQVRLENRVLAVVRLDADVYVLSDRCSHEDFSLASAKLSPTSALLSVSVTGRSSP